MRPSFPSSIRFCYARSATAIRTGSSVSGRDNLDKGWDKEVAAPANFYDWQSQSRSFESLAAYAENSLTLTGIGDAEQIRGAFTTSGLFEVLGARPLLGLVSFVPEENWVGSPASAVISHSLWRRRFGGDRSVLGKPIKLDDVAYAVVGVMPQDFRSPSGEPEVWVTDRRKQAEISQAEWGSPRALSDRRRTAQAGCLPDVGAGGPVDRRATAGEFLSGDQHPPDRRADSAQRLDSGRHAPPLALRRSAPSPSCC